MRPSASRSGYRCVDARSLAERDRPTLVEVGPDGSLDEPGPQLASRGASVEELERQDATADRDGRADGTVGIREGALQALDVRGL